MFAWVDHWLGLTLDKPRCHVAACLGPSEVSDSEASMVMTVAAQSSLGSAIWILERMLVGGTARAGKRFCSTTAQSSVGIGPHFCQMIVRSSCSVGIDPHFFQMIARSSVGTAPHFCQIISRSSVGTAPPRPLHTTTSPTRATASRPWQGTVIQAWVILPLRNTRKKKF